MMFHEYICPQGHRSHHMAPDGAESPPVCMACEDEHSGVAWVADWTDIGMRPVSVLMPEPRAHAGAVRLPLAA